MIAALARSRELLHAAADGIDRIAAIVRDVGGFSWKGGSEPEPADPVELLETALRVAGPQLRRKASVERRFAKLPLVPCRPQELMQVFLNLVLAGVHTIDEHGHLRLSAGTEAAFVWVEIEVDGAGLAPEDLERIFDPFAPSHGGVAQAGLGLAISRQIVERQGGRIQVESQPGRGMRFRVYLPRRARRRSLMHPLAIVAAPRERGRGDDRGGAGRGRLATAREPAGRGRARLLGLVVAVRGVLEPLGRPAQGGAVGQALRARLDVAGSAHPAHRLGAGGRSEHRTCGARCRGRYACAAASILLYTATPWCLDEPVRTSFGWGVRFGPLFPLALSADAWRASAS